MSWKNMPYLMQVYKETSPKIILMGGVQDGKTDWLTIDSLANLAHGLNVFHVFSKDASRKKFFKNRLNILCDRVPLYNQMEINGARARNMYARSMGAAQWVFAISGTKSDFDATSADVVNVDEYDSCDQGNVKLAWDRIQDSDFKLTRISGNPTVTNIGISNWMDASKYYEYHWVCAACDKYIKADYFDVVCEDVIDENGNHVEYRLYDEEWNRGCGRDIYIRCSHCGCLQDRDKWHWKSDTHLCYKAKWIPKYPEATRAGYWLPLLIKLNNRIEDMQQELWDAEGNSFDLQVWFNKRNGSPYTGIGAKITSDLLSKCEGDYTLLEGYTGEGAIAGVDVGKYYDMQVDIGVKGDGERKKMLAYVCRCNSLDEVKGIAERFNVQTMVIDAQPEYNAVREFQEDMYGKFEVILCQIMKARTGNLKIFGIDFNEDEGIYKVDRDWLLVQSHRMYQEQKCMIPMGFESMLDGFWEESMKSITKVKNKDTGNYEWTKADGKDHFRFSDAFSMLAWGQGREAVAITDLSFMADKLREQGKTEEEVAIAVKASQNASPLERNMGLIKKRFGFRGKK